MGGFLFFFTQTHYRSFVEIFFQDTSFRSLDVSTTREAVKTTIFFDGVHCLNLQFKLNRIPSVNNNPLWRTLGFG